jgi:desulfoferrodoxin (superoxide reductase-like protein)
MTANIVPLNFNFQSNTVRGDGLVNITALSTSYRNATGKRKDANDWLRTKEAVESIAYLERVNQKRVTATGIPVATGITEADIVIVENGVGTWVHPDLAEIFAQWISVEYRFAVVQLIRVAKEIKQATQNVVARQLPPVRDAIDYLNAINSHPTLSKDPILLSLLTQRLAEQLSPGVKAIGAPEQPLNVTSIASNLGFSQKAIGNGSALGKYIAARHQPLGTSQHGKYQVNVYLPSEVDATVHEFFALVVV